MPPHSVFFGPFLSGFFFPPNDRAQNHAKKTPLLVLFMLAQKCLWTLRVKNVQKNHTFLNSCIIWEAVELKVVFYKHLQQTVCPET
jgi:hypothetical protein